MSRSERRSRFRNSRTGKAARLLAVNGRMFWWFEILYKLLGVTLFVPMLYGAFDLTMSAAGYHYLTLENLKKSLRHPLILLILLIILAFVGFYTLVDMSAVIYMVHCSRSGHRTDIADTIRFSLRNVSGLFRRGNRRMILLVYLMLPFFSAGQIPELLSSYSVPNMIMISMKNGRFYVILISMILVLSVPFGRLMYTFWYYTLENADGREAVRKSVNLGRGFRIRDLLAMLLAQVFLYALYMLMLALGILAAVLIGRVFSKLFLLSRILFSIVKIILVVLLVVFTVLGPPVTCLMISLLFYDHKVAKGEPEMTITEVNNRKNFRHSAREIMLREKYRTAIGVTESLLFLAAVGACTFYVYQVHRGEMNRSIEFLKTMEVTAHRGASKQFPENTMAAFRGAVEAGADWIELDVHLSRDGRIYTMHDSSFRRTTGVNAMAWELTYEEIEKLDAGSFLGEEFAGERIPLLSEVIDYAKETGIRLNIEIKPSKEEEGLEDALVELLHEKEFTDRCVVTSQQYQSIAKVKQLDETIPTVYVTAFAYGNVNRLIYADNFSVKQSSITQTLVRRVHNAGKQIYAWTVNSRDSIHMMIDREVDNIITDNVALAKRCIAQEMASDTVNGLIQYLNRKIRLGSFRFGG